MVASVAVVVVAWLSCSFEGKIVILERFKFHTRSAAVIDKHFSSGATYQFKGYQAWHPLHFRSQWTDREIHKAEDQQNKNEEAGNNEAMMMNYFQYGSWQCNSKYFACKHFQFCMSQIWIYPSEQELPKQELVKTAEQDNLDDNCHY